MRNWLVGVLAVALLGNAAAGFAKDGGKIDFDQGVDVKAVIQDVKEAAGDASSTGGFQPKGLRDWTVMVYINGKNNLETYGLKDVNEMEMVGSSDKVAVVVELGRIIGHSSEDGNWIGSRRYLIQKDNDAKKITSPVLQDLGKVDMGDWNHVVEFVKWAKTTAPAKRTMLIIWNHGSGWNRFYGKGDVWTNGISYDDETGNHITTDQLGQAVAATGKLDILSMDACLMQMAEVAYQVRDYTDVVVASEETEPADGYAYDTMLAGIIAKSDVGAKEVGRIASETYRDYYAKKAQGATQSAVNSASLKALLAKADAWTAAVMGAKEVDVLKTAMKSAQYFYYSDNKDLYHFVKLVTESTKVPAVKSKGIDLLAFISDEVVAANAVTGTNYVNAFGLAVYLPAYSYSSNYDKLAWSVDGNWDVFAKWISDATRE